MRAFLRRLGAVFSTTDTPPQRDLYYTDPKQWGAEFMRVRSPIAPSVTVVVLKAPEGYRIVGSCSRCAETVERLADLRGKLSIADPVRSKAVIRETFEREIPAISEAWANRHLTCGDHLRRSSVPVRGD